MIPEVLFRDFRYFYAHTSISSNDMDRRTFNKNILGTVLSYSLLTSLFANEAISPALRPLTDHWAKVLNEYCKDLKQSSISPAKWQEQVEALFRQIELNELLKFIDFDRLAKGMQFPDLGVSTKPVSFPKLEGLPSKTVFYKKVFGLKKDRAIIPHGHSNMASAHLVLNGSFHMRHYEKVQEEKQHLVIKPTIDRTAEIGDCSSISDEKDNVHWFIANTDRAFTFDVILLDLNHRSYDIHNLDILAAEGMSNGLLRAKKLGVQEALKKYGKVHH